MGDQLLPIPQVPDGLREASQLGELILFIGAGASRLAGCPGWPEFADGALQWMIGKGKFSHAQFDQVRHLNPRVKLFLARNLEAETGIPIDFRSLLHPIELRAEKRANGIRLYNSLFKLGNRFVTTNYDEWLDKRIVQSTPSVTPDTGVANSPLVDSMRVIHKAADLLPADLFKSNTVIHLHGSLCDPEGMVLTTQDYVRHYANDRHPAPENPVLTFLATLFQNTTVLFIGYGLEELEILEYVISKARRPAGDANREAKHYILQGFFSHEEPLLRSLESHYLKECGIQLIKFLKDNKGWDQLLEVLENWAQIMPASGPLILRQMREMEDLLNG